MYTTSLKKTIFDADPNPIVNLQYNKLQVIFFKKLLVPLLIFIIEFCYIYFKVYKFIVPESTVDPSLKYVQPDTDP